MRRAGPWGCGTQGGKGWADGGAGGATRRSGGPLPVVG